MLIAIDTGGTKTLVASFRRDGTPHATYRFPTPNDPQEYVVFISNFLKKHYDLVKVDVIVIAVPGVVKSGVAIWCDNLGWQNVPLEKMLIKHGITNRILLENDANLAGLGEVRSLVRIPRLALYLTVSTGIGSGIIIDGHLHDNFRNSEAGHSVIFYDGQYQEWENFASGKAIRETYDKFARDIPKSDTKTWQEVAEKISLGLLVVIPTLQPEILIIGGSIGTYFSCYEGFLKEILASQLTSHVFLPELRQAKHPEEAVIYGCYCYGIDALTH